MKTSHRLLVSALFLAAFCCAPLASSLRAADPATFTVGSFTFKRPASLSWVPVNPAGMRKAQLKFADPANPSGPGAEIVFFHFGAGQGGGVESNISRWVGQFSAEGDKKLDPTVENATVNGTKITRIKIDRGIFASGMPGGPTTPQAGYGLQGAILESAQGDVFIKMTGPAEHRESGCGGFRELGDEPAQRRRCGRWLEGGAVIILAVSRRPRGCSLRDAPKVGGAAQRRRRGIIDRRPPVGASRRPAPRACRCYT